MPKSQVGGHRRDMDRQWEYTLGLSFQPIGATKFNSPVVGTLSEESAKAARILEQFIRKYITSKERRWHVVQYNSS